jgi:hypothetical protein
VLRNKAITGVSKPMSLVEEVLTQQGFRRRGSKEEPVFRLNMQDTATMRSYSLDIPFREEEQSRERVARLGSPYVVAGSSTVRTTGMDDVPQSVSWAAESKLAEVADYLTMYDYK